MSYVSFSLDVIYGFETILDFRYVFDKLFMIQAAF